MSYWDTSTLGNVSIVRRDTCSPGVSTPGQRTEREVRPEGTAEGGEYSQSSLRDEGLCSDLPDVETPGYCRMSLRDKTPAACARRFLIAPRQQNRREALADAQAAGRLAYRHAGRFDSRALSLLDAGPEVREGDQFNYRLIRWHPP